MKKIAIVSLALLVTACSSSSDYQTDVTSESYQENYQTTQAEVDAKAPKIEEQDVTADETVNTTDAQGADSAPQSTPVQEATAQQSTQAPVTEDVTPSALTPKKGFAIQLATLSDKEHAKTFAQSLMATTTLWIQSKTLHQKQVYSVVMGDYEDYDQAKAAVTALPSDLQKLKPFVKNFTDKELAATDSFELLK
ncbi:SPOR domain-containing protein [Vibrio rarus]|uniref:SPOR domain-containing protein n=1 Tax=Vibrio rarus TaxID=413403 RepID=UPI0021C35A39|nr:SPOR domain-containing protein [Vibrio rarus]